MAQVDTSQRRLSAIMFSDICGYSLLMGENEARAMEVLALHDKVISDRIEQAADEEQKVRISEIHLKDDRTSATVIPEIRRRGMWKPVRLVRWRLQEGEWYLVLGDRTR